jgi:hypothetical protein
VLKGGVEVMSIVANVFREAREGFGTRKMAASMLGASERTIESYELDKRSIPEDIIGKAAFLFNRPEISIIKCFNCEAGLLKIPYLDLVDRHPVVVQLKTIEELKEAANSLESINLINKCSNEQLSEIDKKKLDNVLEQTLDVLTAVTMLVVVLSTRFSIDIKSLTSKHHTKLAAKHYVSKR